MVMTQVNQIRKVHKNEFIVFFGFMGLCVVLGVGIGYIIWGVLF
jgi:hypothetical protein